MKRISTRESLRLPVEMASKVQREAARRHTTKTAVIIEALECYFGKQEMVLTMAAFMASSELLAMARKQEAEDLRKRMIQQARTLLEVNRDDIHTAGSGQQKDRQGVGTGESPV